MKNFEFKYWIALVSLSLLTLGSGWAGIPEVLAQTESPGPANPLDLNPSIQNSSPVLQRWQKSVPDVQGEIRHDPSFRPRFRLGYRYFPSSSDTSGLALGVEDLFLGRSPVTLSANYETNFRDQQSGGGDLQYYVLPLGGYVNVTPLVGYRYLQTDNYNTQGLNLGAKLAVALSRDGAADLSFKQSFISPGSDNEVGISTFSVGYALSQHWRIATDLQQQNSRAQKDHRLGIYLEWMP